MVQAQTLVMIIQVVSAGFDGGNQAVITINDVPIEVGKNESGHYRGLHIVLVNPLNGNVEWARVFDTYKDDKAFDEFTKMVPDGTIVIAACKDDCVTQLSEEGK